MKSKIDRTPDRDQNPLDPFYTEGNIRYLEGLMEDVKAGRARFEKHDLIDPDET